MAKKKEIEYTYNEKEGKYKAVKQTVKAENPFNYDRREAEDLKSYYRRLAKQADQRLVRLEGYSHRDGFMTVTKWAYARAMNDIRKWNGEEAKRFNTAPPENIQQLEAKIADIRQFLESPTSTMQGVISIYQAKANTLNKNYGTNFTWEDLAQYYLSDTNKKFDEKFGSQTSMDAIAEMQKQEKNIVRAIEKETTDKIHIKVPNKIVKSAMKKALADSGINFSLIFKDPRVNTVVKLMQTALELEDE